VVATLFGVSAPDITKARVLELGSAEGRNIIPSPILCPVLILPAVDFSPSSISRGQALVNQLGLKNIDLRTMNILDINKELGQFDYIICHGVYSWVPEQVKAKILRLIAEQLSENGLAYISYNCYPGWHVRDISRYLMLYHTTQFSDAKLQLHQARALMDFVAQNATQRDKPLPKDCAGGGHYHPRD